MAGRDNSLSKVNIALHRLQACSVSAFCFKDIIFLINKAKISGKWNFNAGIWFFIDRNIYFRSSFRLYKFRAAYKINEFIRKCYFKRMKCDKYRHLNWRSGDQVNYIDLVMIIFFCCIVCQCKFEAIIPSDSRGEEIESAASDCGSII